MKSLYAKYLEEKTNIEILESDYGFVTYEIQDTRCYISDVFTIKEKRLEGLMLKMCLEVGEIAKARGCDCVIGTVILSNKDSTEGLKACISMGMKLLKAENNVIYLIRDI